MGQTAIVLQARIGSTRLPGKALADLAGRSLLGHCIWRLQESELPVIVATTTRGEDDVIVDEARRHGAQVFRGDDHDVLKRFVDTAEAFGLTEIIRATADNPAVDFHAPGRTMQIRRHARVDHVVECGLPIGAAVEAMTTQALTRAAGMTEDPYHREHVTPFIRTSQHFRALHAIAPGHLRRPSLRLTVDTSDDLTFMRRLLAPFRQAKRPPALGDIFRVVDGLAASLTSRREA